MRAFLLAAASAVATQPGPSLNGRGDWGGNGITTIGVYSDGNWCLDKNQSWAWDGEPTDTFGIFGVGHVGVTPVTGNW
ncbi:MAG: hypothetical protein M0042_10050 [Nitrospiraceae bacterium]|nr:hypothetical protein [Nitrospiraceae bacterium]